MCCGLRGESDNSKTWLSTDLTLFTIWLNGLFLMFFLVLHHDWRWVYVFQSLFNAVARLAFPNKWVRYGGYYGQNWWVSDREGFRIYVLLSSAFEVLTIVETNYYSYIELSIQCFSVELFHVSMQTRENLSKIGCFTGLPYILNIHVSFRAVKCDHMIVGLLNQWNLKCCCVSIIGRV